MSYGRIIAMARSALCVDLRSFLQKDTRPAQPAWEPFDDVLMAKDDLMFAIMRRLLACSEKDGPCSEERLAAIDFAVQRAENRYDEAVEQWRMSLERNLTAQEERLLRKADEFLRTDARPSAQRAEGEG